MIRSLLLLVAVILTSTVTLWVGKTGAQEEAVDTLVLPVRPTGGALGGRLVVALRAEPTTFNPPVAFSGPSRTVIHLLHANLVNIHRRSGRTEPALARKWTASPDGRKYRLELRRGVRFSDGHPLDADDILFTFRVYLDEAVGSLQRGLLLINGKPPSVSRVDAHTVEVELPGPYAVGDRLFDGLAILPEHRLGEAYRGGRLTEVWGPATEPRDIVGLGPFRLKRYIPGERIELERNPYYWKQDATGRPLPYLDSLTFLVVPSQDAQALRFQAGEIHLVDDLPPQSFEALHRTASSRGVLLQDLGPDLRFEFLFFNLNDLPEGSPPERLRKQRWFRDVRFRHAISRAIDREGIAQLLYLGHATPIATHVTPGNPKWLNTAVQLPERSVLQARRLLKGAGFSWDESGRLKDRDGVAVEFTLVTNASTTARVRMTALIQEDLRALGIRVRPVALDLGDVMNRIYESYDYDAILVGLGSGDIDPNPEMPIWLSDGGSHLWHLGQDKPATLWEAEIDDLMRRQMVTLDPQERKRLYDRVQVLVAEHLPMLFLVAPNVLVGARQGLGGFEPAVLEPHTLWNVEQLYWRTER